MDLQKNNRELKICIPVFLFILVISSLSYFVFEQDTLKQLSAEDGVVENLSALNWLLSALVMFFLFFHRKNIWLLLLAVFFVVCLGEEISWGQRMIGYATPEAVQNNNYQGEFNLHNLNLFDRRSGDKSAWQIMYDLGRLFAIFWFLYGCVLPVLIKISTRLNRFVQKIQLPIMPLYIGIFFMINYLVFQYFEDIHVNVCLHLGIVNNANCSSLPVEIREWYESLLFLVFALLVLKKNVKNSIPSRTWQMALRKKSVVDLPLYNAETEKAKQINIEAINE